MTGPNDRRTTGGFRPGIVLAVLLLLAGPVAAQSVQVIPKSGLWVTDRAELLSDSEERLLSARMAAFADSTSTQLVIVTLPSLDGVEPVDYAVELGRAWGVGQEGRDNGVVILVSRDDRQLFIAPGYGLEATLTDAAASQIVRRIMLPRFREGAFYQGLSDGVDAVMLTVKGEFEALEPESSGRPGPNLLFLFVIAVILFIVLTEARGAGKGPGSPKRRRHTSGPVILWGGGFGSGGGSFGGFGGGGGGFGGFSGGGGSFGGGGAGGGW